MALESRIASRANDEKLGMSIEEVLEFASAVESALVRGDLKREDLIIASVGFSNQIKRITAIKLADDKGKWNIP